MSLASSSWPFRIWHKLAPQFHLLFTVQRWNYSKDWDKTAAKANSADPDQQSDLGLHCLPLDKDVFDKFLLVKAELKFKDNNCTNRLCPSVCGNYGCHGFQIIEQMRSDCQTLVPLFIGMAVWLIVQSENKIVNDQIVFFCFQVTVSYYHAKNTPFLSSILPLFRHGRNNEDLYFLSVSSMLLSLSLIGFFLLSSVTKKWQYNEHIITWKQILSRKGSSCAVEDLELVFLLWLPCIISGEATQLLFSFCIFLKVVSP